jgi:hypothetical protein
LGVCLLRLGSQAGSQQASRGGQAGHTGDGTWLSHELVSGVVKPLFDLRLKALSAERSIAQAQALSN